jgi:pantetheine-phosphate adenylyltransferase
MREIVQTAIYAGSFDPPTYGHLDLVERAARLFPRVIVALGLNPSRQAVFSLSERREMMETLCEPFANVEVESFEGLLVDYATRIGARVIVRGLRVGTDFEYELQIAHANADMKPELDTVFLPTRTNYGFISASLVREIAQHGGDVSRYAPESVCDKVKARFAK